jgi:F-type H+-transporting ATPase subunit b
MRRLLLAIAIASASTFSLGGVALAQHGDDALEVHGPPHGDLEHGDLPEEIATDHQHGEPHQASFSDMFWTERGPNGEPPFMARVLAFAIWAFILVYFGRKPLADFLAVRRRSIVDGLEEAQRVEAAAKAKQQEYQSRIDNLDAEIEKLRADFQRAGMEERDRMVAEASRRAERMHAEAKFLVEQQLKTLREELTREAIEAAVGAAEKILRDRSTGADQQRLADEYLARLRQSVEQGTQKGTPS